MKAPEAAFLGQFGRPGGVTELRDGDRIDHLPPSPDPVASLIEAIRELTVAQYLELRRRMKALLNED